MLPEEITPQDILEFWYASDISLQWFNATQSLDTRILHDYESLWRAARTGQLDAWQSTAEGCLALAIVLDQLPLNMFRGKAASFASEAQAIAVSKQAIKCGLDTQLPAERLAFLYMPLMHSENIDDQNLSVSLFEAAGLTNNAKFARHHRNIVERFGRFPHRNAVLGRHSTQQELEWLASDEAFTG